MKILLTFKTPDVVDYAIRDALPVPDTKEEEEEHLDLEYKIRTACERFVRFGEYVSIEIDTETGEARVMEVN